jgi:hypothetical protein
MQSEQQLASSLGSENADFYCRLLMREPTPVGRCTQAFLLLRLDKMNKRRPIFFRAESSRPRGEEAQGLRRAQLFHCMLLTDVIFVRCSSRRVANCLNRGDEMRSTRV